ncbi:hypothetical protein D9756_009814 [Leucocoprinus leucothites]|uniref:DUF7770 domain-containing protein n=1 Tax=Leucocoprinus leucothites TaxID=201217 RepID=A0A8H5CWZ0_9AGAR|nr:hypothetical protein D9756_009814 [Leucoagaricus leucothites]
MTDTVKQPALIDESAKFRLQKLHQAVFWCSMRGSPHHWITSYAFADGIVEVDGGRYAGISLDMFQPVAHKNQPPGENKNLFGTLRFGARKENVLMSKNPAFMVMLAFKTKITVQELYNLVVGNKLHLYQYSPAGSGCMYWQSQLLKKFVVKGWLAQEDLAKLFKSLEAYAKQKGSQAVPYPPVEGKYYNI